ncbi:MAG: heparinase II/III family protein, partial [Armatimonadota bacterium]
MREIAIILLSLICAVAMAAHPPEVKKVADEVVTEVAIDGDAEFFAAWNLEYPGLEAVKTAVENEDYDAAKVALKEYFLQRREPQWRISHWEMPEEPRGNAEDHSAYGEGEQILEHKFSGGGYEVDFDDEIDWNYFPKKLPNGKPDTEYPVIHYINRFGHLNTLGKLYWFSHDEKYAREFVDQITDHIEKNPAPEEYIRYTSVWSRLTAAVPLNGSWLNAYNYFLPSEHFTPEAHAMMLRRFIEKARYAIVAPDRVNRYMAQLTGVYATGAYFPELKQAEGFRELGELGIRKAAENEFYPDGMSKELCPGYHGGSRGAITRLIDFAEIFGYAPPMDVLEILRQTYLIYPKITTPLRGLPDFGDTWGPKDGVVVRIFKDICNKYNDTPEIDEAITDPVFEWFSTEGAEGHAPEFTSTRMPWAGFYAMRSGWDRDALYLCADLGPLGAGHWHEDFSNFECYAYGQRLIADMSTHSYTTSIWKNYFYSSPAHNVVLVDGLSQDRAADASETLYIDEPGTDDWHSDDVFDLAWGEYDDRWVDYTEYTGWVNRFGAEAAVHLATHRREFAF